MTTPVVDRYESIQYDGTNEAAVAAAVPQYTFISEDANGLAFQSGFGSWFCPPGGWIVYSPRFLSVLSQWNDTASFEEAYRVLPEQAALEALQADVETLQTQLTAVVTALASSIVGVGADSFNFGAGNSTVNVAIQPAQPDTSFTPLADLFGGLNLGALSITGVSVVDASTVAVTINNSGLLALGASLLVTVRD
jgi:hypothetical protein